MSSMNRRKLKLPLSPISALSRAVVFLTLVLFSFNMTVSAAIVTTFQTTNPGQFHEVASVIAAKNINRSDLEQQLVALGVAPEQLQSRLNSMTDVEITALSAELSQLPAGGDALTTIALVFLVLLFTDIAGYTDLFPFVKKVSRKNTNTQHEGKVIDRRVNRKQKEPIVIEN